jgi:hypothetical protein
MTENTAPPPTLLRSILLLWLLPQNPWDNPNHWPQLMIEQVQFKRQNNTHQCYFGGCPDQDLGWPFIFKGLIKGPCTYSFWSGFCQLKEQCTPPAQLSSASITTATHSLGYTTSLATIHTTHEIASTVLIPLMSHDEEKMHPQVIVSGSPNQEIWW